MYFGLKLWGDCYWDSQCHFSCFKSQFVFNRRENSEYNVLQYSSTVACGFHSTLENESWNGVLSMLGNRWGQKTMSQLCFWAVIVQKTNSNNTRFTHYTAECLLLLYMHGNLRSRSTVGLRWSVQMSMLWPRMLVSSRTIGQYGSKNQQLCEPWMARDQFLSLQQVLFVVWDILVILACLALFQGWGKQPYCLLQGLECIVIIA